MKAMIEADDEGSPWVDLLDDLIEKYFHAITNKVEKDAKLGDLLKMIELRHKLSPTGVDQKRFWKLVDEIRRSEFKPGGKPPSDPKEKKSA